MWPPVVVQHTMGTGNWACPCHYQGEWAAGELHLCAWPIVPAHIAHVPSPRHTSSTANATINLVNRHCKNFQPDPLAGHLCSNHPAAHIPVTYGEVGRTRQKGLAPPWYFTSIVSYQVGTTLSYATYSTATPSQLANKADPETGATTMRRMVALHDPRPIHKDLLVHISSAYMLSN